MWRIKSNSYFVFIVLTTLLSKPEVCLLLFRLNHSECMVWSFSMGKGKPQNQRFTDCLCASYCILKLLQTFSFCTYSSQDARRGPCKVIDVTVQVEDSRLSLTESSKVWKPSPNAGKFMLNVTVLLLIGRESLKLRAMIRQSQGLTIEPFTVFGKFLHGLVTENPSPPLKRKPKK